MRRLISAVAILLAVLLWHGEAAAACTTNTFILPDGRMIVCTTCCMGAYCTTTCF